MGKNLMAAASYAITIASLLIPMRKGDCARAAC